MYFQTHHLICPHQYICEVASSGAGTPLTMRKPQTYFLEIVRLMNLLLGSPNITFRFPASTDERSGSVSMFSSELRKAELKHP